MPLSDPAPGGEPPPEDPRVGSLLADRYRIDALLGEGGMGRVYAAEHVRMRKRLAVKVLHRELTTVPDVVARFEREAMAAANIDHPNVATATDFGKLADGCVFMVMEYVEGRNLRDEIADGPLPVERAAAIARQIASALASAHALSIVHRDLKPENVMLVTKGADSDFVKVLDFGIARVPIGEGSDPRSKPITKAGMVFGTPEYMAPEQALGQVVDGRADLYALGVIFFEMLSGVRPFVASSQTGVLGQQLSRAAPTFAERSPGLRVPAAIEQIVLRLLDREATARFPSASEVVGAIDAALGANPGDPARIFTRIGGTGAMALDRGVESPASGAPSLGAREADGSLPSAPGDEPAGAAVAASAGGSPARRPARLAAAPLAEAPAALRFVARLLDWVDDSRRRLRPPLRDVPAPFFLGAAATVLLGATLGLLAHWSGGRESVRIGSSSAATTSVELAVASSPASGSAGPKGAAAAQGRPVAFLAAPSASVAAAARRGVDALSELAARYPRDATVAIAQGRALAAEHRPADAVSALDRALTQEPERAEDPAVQDLARQLVAVPEVRDRTLTLLSNRMGAAGADVIYSLATGSGVAPDLRARADALVRAPGFVERASPALRVAVHLRTARTCSDIAGTLEAARTDGDSRALRYLQAYLDTKACKVKRRRVDCWPCLRRDRSLAAAIEAIAARASSSP